MTGPASGVGLRVQGRDSARATEILRDAVALQDAGAWAIVLELVPAALAAEVTARLDPSVPAEPGRRMPLAADLDHMHLIEPASGRVL